MTPIQITEGQRRRMEAAAESVAAKLQAFHEGLTPEEQRALDLAMRQLGAHADEAPADTIGYIDPFGARASSVLVRTVAILTPPYYPPLPPPTK